MAQQKPTAFLFLDKRRLKKNGKYPVKLIVDFREEKKIYRLPYDFTEGDWTKIHSPRLKNEELKIAKEKLSILTGDKFNSVLRKMEEQGIAFTFKKFGELYFNKITKSKESRDVYSVFDTYLDELVSQGRIGTADSYRTSLHALQGYRKRLKFEMITPKFLQDFESHLLQKKKISETTVGIYMRSLRVIINYAIHNPDIAVRMEYPFSQHPLDRKYKIPTGANIKKALSFEDIERLKAYKGETDSEQRALDFWLFSYYCNGINMSDLCKLRFENILGDQIVFRRSKTARARKNPKVIQAYLHPEMKKIIEKWGEIQIVGRRTTSFQFLNTTAIQNENTKSSSNLRAG